MAHIPSGVADSIWKARQLILPTSTPTKRPLPFMGGYKVTRMSPLVFCRVALMFEGEELGRVVITPLGLTYLESSKATAHKNLGQGALTYLTTLLGYLILPTGY